MKYSLKAKETRNFPLTRICKSGVPKFHTNQSPKIWHLCIGQFQLRPCPPRANPRALAIFFSWMANSRGWGHSSCQMPRGGDEGRGQIPRPQDRTSPINTAAVFIHCTIVPLSAF